MDWYQNEFSFYEFTRLILLFQVLQTGQEIMELDHSGFSTQGPTIYAGNIGSNKYIIQVSTNGVRLLEGGKILKTILNFITLTALYLFIFYLNDSPNINFIN